jgi:hypothetical protein
MPTGTAVSVVVGNQDTVAVFKEKIAQKTGIPMSQQTLTYAGSRLIDANLLTGYRIRRGCTVVMVVPVAGGSRRRCHQETSAVWPMPGKRADCEPIRAGLDLARLVRQQYRRISQFRFSFLFQAA